MTQGPKHLKGRLTLLATLVATSVLIAAPVQAGKAPPVFTGTPDIACGVTGQLTATFDVEGKGKWVYVDLDIVVDGTRVDEWPGDKKDGTKPIVWDYRLDVTNMEATLVDRKGQPFLDPIDGTVVEGTTTGEMELPDC
jgi:hypothetical protein